MIKKLGFTLIEILVVIAIVGLLASMIISSTKGARDKAKNARITSDIMEYAKALSLYQSDNSGFLHYPVGTVCLGGGYTAFPMPGTCGPQNGSGGPGLRSESDTLKAALNPYFPGDETSLPPVGNNMFVTADNGVNYLGAIYRCTNGTTPNCKQATITVYLQGDVSCPRPANSLSSTPQSSYPGITDCIIVLQ